MVLNEYLWLWNYWTRWRFIEWGSEKWVSETSSFWNHGGKKHFATTKEEWKFAQVPVFLFNDASVIFIQWNIVKTSIVYTIVFLCRKRPGLILFVQNKEVVHKILSFCQLQTTWSSFVYFEGQGNVGLRKFMLIVLYVPVYITVCQIQVRARVIILINQELIFYCYDR